jgi:ribosomal protein S18 acetylase RimI-like enzyme
MAKAEIALLDNPIWNALRTDQAPIALGDDRARRYPPEIGPLAGIPEQSTANYEALSTLAGPGIVALFSVEPFRIPAGWKILREGPIVQMIREHPQEPNRNVNAPSVGTASTSPSVGSATSDSPTLRRLTSPDAPSMVALAQLTEPGPFHLRTMDLGNFYGIFHDGRLVSMAGKRMHLPGLVEVSGVCTHPDARGRGYARLLMSIVIEEIERDGKTAFLHAYADNPAISLYEQLGFALRQNFQFAVVTPGS